jgi:hypothetical protein
MFVPAVIDRRYNLHLPRRRDILEMLKPRIRRRRRLDWPRNRRRMWKLAAGERERGDEKRAAEKSLHAQN